ncbi:hypothetical protein HRI_001346800 [Hibiscus trionum]|uniref:C3H1-type domain-containing protein n=1 Tax=Hibiscus trionum TaxID=183268 RepID=A0A9W7LVL8_HIBTR|nr:hypothetical protein HRI_001346800 [Hibiscus trionum]
MDSRTIHVRSSENASLEQPYPLVIAVASLLPGDDSDMEMEDDITQIDEDQGMDHSPKGLNSRSDINNDMLNVKEQLYCQPVQISTDGNANKDILSEKDSAAGCNANKEDLEGIAKINSVKSTVPTKQPPVMSLEKSNTSGQLAKSVCSFGLIQNYASDDNSEDVEVGSSVYSDRLQKESRLEDENMNLGSQHKLDKFGRLVRDGASDSDSDDSCYIGRYKRRRPRSRNQSHSPLDRRRRNPQRRKKRSLSRSWSPRNRRSRSRSPRNRRSRSRSPRNRRSRSRSPRNRRSRSSSPRNRRSRSRSPRNRRSRSRSPRNRRSKSRSPRNRRSKSRSPRNRRSKSRSPSFQHTDKFSGENKRRVKGQMPFCFDFRRGKCYRGVSCRYLHHDSGKSNESRWQRSKQPYLELPHASRTNNACEVIKQSSEKRENSADGGVHYQDNQSNEHHMVKSDRSRDIPASLFETHLLENKQETTNPVSYENCQEAATESQHLSTIDSSSVGNINTLKSCGNASQEVLTSFSSPLDPVCQSANCQPQQSDNSFMSDSLPGKPSTSPLNRLPESNVHPHAMELHNHPCHISSPSVLCSHGKANPHMKEQQTASSTFQSSGESFRSYMLPSQQSYLALQPNLSFTSLPLPPPPPPPPSLDSTVTPSVSSHFRPSYFHPRNDFGSQIIPRPYLTELPACSQSDGFQQRAYPPIQDANQPILQVSLPVCSLPGAPCISRDDGLTQPPMQNVIASNSFSQGNTHPHTLPFSQQFLGSKMQPFPTESLPPGGLSYTSYIHPYAQQQPPHSSHHPMIDGIYNLGGKMNSSSKVPPNIGDTSSHRDDIGGSSSSIPNPNASNNTPFSLAHHPVHGRGIEYQQATLSPNSTRAFGQNCLRTGGDQYDPLFDSIEPSSSLLRKNNCIQKLDVTGDSDILFGLSGSNKPLNMGQNNQRKDAASVASAGSEEFGETADGEVGAVESGSPSNPVEVNMATSEVEIDQIKSQGKSKDSRSMKHFKVALACFVKELLKPSWQQGNMSKEAFKTIVKKTVDKVSGAIKSHHIPKSRTKIDLYIESSQQKLTKLVMGYVDKYVNV